MDGRIGHLYCRYRVLGTPGSAGLVADRLDRLARSQVAEAWAEALDQILGDDPTVYVLRRVQTGLALNADRALTDAHLAQRWGERLAGAVMRRIAHDPDDGANLVCFADQADYVAHFITDLIEGRAWRRWFYGVFASLRPRSTGDALRAVLVDNGDHLPAILSFLYRYEALEKLLAYLDEATLRWLWSQGLGAYISAAPETTRPLFARALDLADRLGLWAKPRPQGEALFQAYLATGPPAADWRDGRGLARAVLDALRFLAGQGYLRRLDPAKVETFLARLEQALLDFDWLDADWLRAALLDLLAGSKRPETVLPVRPTGYGPTQRQRELLADLAAALRAGGARLDRGQPDSAANALRLYAWLVAHAPRWADDAMVTGLIQRLLAAWRWLEQIHPRAEALRRLRQGDIEGALGTLPETNRAGARAAFKFLADLGEPGLALVATLAGEERPRPAAADTGIETQCAGVYLLLRAILDARLPVLVGGAAFPPQGTDARRIAGPTRLEACLLALGLRWAGEPALVEEEIDPGLGPLVGLEVPPALAVLQAAWSGLGPANHSRFQAALLRILAGQRLVGGSTLHLYRVAVKDGVPVLVAGDGRGDLWPLGRVVETAAEVTGILAEWLEVWNEATGRRPAVVTYDQSLADIAGLGLEAEAPDVVAVPEIRASGTSDALDEIGRAHQTGREALLSALAALDHSRLDLPEVDLTLALTASALLRVWARWLRQFAISGVPYLLANFIRRPGRVTMDANSILVELEPGPLDVVIDMAGYTAELENVSWLGQRRVRFQLRG